MHKRQKVEFSSFDVSNGSRSTTEQTMQIDTMVEPSASEIDPELFQVYLNMCSDKTFVRNLQREPSDLKREYS